MAPPFLSNTGLLKPFFGKSMRLAGKEKKGRLTPIKERTGRVKP